MRGPDHPQTAMFSYVSIEDRIPVDHPLRAIQAEAALLGSSPSEGLYRHVGETASGESQPISDQRGSAAFRRTLVRALTVKCLTQAVETVRTARSAAGP